MKTEFQEITRRKMLEKLLAGAVAGVAWPAVASTHPIYHLLNEGTALDRADAAAQSAASWRPLFLSQQQNDTLIALSETIVPGSAEAKVNRFIDLLLSVDEAQNREKFVTSLAAVEHSAQAKLSRTFDRLTAKERDELLDSFSAEEAHEKDFAVLKEWVTIAYYSSEQGMRELGWTGVHAFRTFPACSATP